MFARSCAKHTIERNAFKFKTILIIISNYFDETDNLFNAGERGSPLHTYTLIYFPFYIFNFQFTKSAVFHRFVHQNSCGNRRIKGIYLTFHRQ